MIRALLIKGQAIDMILKCRKNWEIRGSRTNICGEIIGLIPCGSGTVVGTCILTKCIGPLSAREYRENARKLGLRPAEIENRPYGSHTYAWVIKKPKRLKKPVPYKHRYGAIIWVRLGGKTEQAIQAQHSAKERL